jgi:hypothetical protein
MSLGRASGLLAGACGLLALVMLPVARAYVHGGGAPTRQSLHVQSRTRPPTAISERAQAPAVPPMNPPGAAPENLPLNEVATATDPETGTLTLASLGLLALGVAMQTRRGRYRRDAPAIVDARSREPRQASAPVSRVGGPE